MEFKDVHKFLLDKITDRYNLYVSSGSDKESKEYREIVQLNAILKETTKFMGNDFE